MGVPLLWMGTSIFSCLPHLHQHAHTNTPLLLIGKEDAHGFIPPASKLPFASSRKNIDVTVYFYPIRQVAMGVCVCVCMRFSLGKQKRKGLEQWEQSQAQQTNFRTFCISDAMQYGQCCSFKGCIHFTAAPCMTGSTHQTAILWLADPKVLRKENWVAPRII